MNRRTVRVALIALLLSIAPPLFAQEHTLAGHWTGRIETPGTALEIDLDFAMDDAGWTGDITIPAQQARDLPLVSIAQDGATVSFVIGGIPGDPTFTGTIDGDTMVGDFNQGGQTFAFEAERGEDRAGRARERLAGIDPIIEQALVDFGVPGLAIAVVAGDEVVLAKGYGLRDVDNELPVTPATLFAIGSTTKAFTAFVLGTLVDEGKLDWDTPVIEYLPDFRMSDAYATDHLKVRDLLIHSSGLPRHDLAWYNSAASREELFKRLAHLEPTRDLGEEFQYQNLMFMTAGYLVERITGTPWEQLVAERIFAPLEMSRSNFSVETSKADPDHAEPYALDDGVAEHVPFRNIDQIGPAGSINSSVAEMSQWLRLQLGGGEIGGTRLIQDSTLKQMHAPHMAISAYPSSQTVLTLGYGMGWAIESHRGHFLVQHGGGIDGFISWVALAPLEDFGVVVYTNAAGANPVPTAVARTVIDRVLGLDDGGYLERAKTALAAAAEAAAEETATTEARRVDGTVPSHPLDDYAGDYEHPGYGQIGVTVEGGALRLVYNDMAATLEHWHYDTFRGADEDSQLNDLNFLFRLDADGAISEVLAPFEPTVGPIAFERLAEASLSDPEYLRRFVGKYTLQTQEVTFELRGDTLFGTVTGQPTFELAPKGGTEFTIAGADGFSVEFLLDEAGAVTAARFAQPNGVFEATRVQEQ